MSTPDPTESNPSPIALKQALDTVRELLALVPLPTTPLRGLDPSRAAGVVIGCLPRIEKHRAALEAQFGSQATRYLDELPIIAYATKQADIELTASDSMRDLSDRFDEVANDHRLLLTDAEALANRKLLDRTRVEAGRPAQGYRTTVTSVLVLIALLRECWTCVEKTTPLTPGELDAIEARAQAMLKLLDEREHGSTRSTAAELRTRSLHLLVRTYGEVRRMLTYVRWWEEDADTIAPSLWTARRKSRSQNEAEDGGEGSPDPEMPALPLPIEPDEEPFTS